MLKYILVIFAFGYSSAYAANLKVLKIKGQKAIVQIPAGMDVEAGQTLSVSDSGGSSFGQIEGRGNRIDGELSYSTQTVDSKTVGISSSADTTTIAISAEYGWNTGRFEFGPNVNYSSVSATNSDASSWTLAGFFEYNFSENKSGVSFVPFVGATLGYGSYDPGSGDTYSGLDFSAYGGARWFPLSDTLAIVPKVSYRQSTRDYDGDNGSTSKVMLVGLGVAKYF